MKNKMIAVFESTRQPRTSGLGDALAEFAGDAGISALDIIGGGLTTAVDQTFMAVGTAVAAPGGWGNRAGNLIDNVLARQAEETEQIQVAAASWAASHTIALSQLRQQYNGQIPIQLIMNILNTEDVGSTIPRMTAPDYRQQLAQAVLKEIDRIITESRQLPSYRPTTTATVTPTVDAPSDWMAVLDALGLSDNEWAGYPRTAYDALSSWYRDELARIGNEYQTGFGQLLASIRAGNYRNSDPLPELDVLQLRYSLQREDLTRKHTVRNQAITARSQEARAGLKAAGDENRPPVIFITSWIDAPPASPQLPRFHAGISSLRREPDTTQIFVQPKIDANTFQKLAGALMTEDDRPTDEAKPSKNNFEPATQPTLPLTDLVDDLMAMNGRTIRRGSLLLTAALLAGIPSTTNDLNPTPPLFGNQFAVASNPPQIDWTDAAKANSFYAAHLAPKPLPELTPAPAPASTTAATGWHPVAMNPDQITITPTSLTIQVKDGNFVANIRLIVNDVINQNWTEVVPFHTDRQLAHALGLSSPDVILVMPYTIERADLRHQKPK